MLMILTHPSFIIRAHLLERELAGALHFGVRVVDHFGEARHDGGQAGGELLGRAEGHGAQQLHRPHLRAPLLLLQALRRRTNGCTYAS
eukprot:6772548-Pyramimonas_sp.AAC.1